MFCHFLVKVLSKRPLKLKMKKISLLHVHSGRRPHSTQTETNQTKLTTPKKPTMRITANLMKHSGPLHTLLNGPAQSFINQHTPCKHSNLSSYSTLSNAYSNTNDFKLFGF